MGGGGGRLQPKKPVPNLKFSVFSFFFFVFFGFFVFFPVLFRFFRQEFQPFKNHVNNEVLGGQELPNNTLLNAYKALQMFHKSYYNQQDPVKPVPIGQIKR